MKTTTVQLFMSIGLCLLSAIIFSCRNDDYTVPPYTVTFDGKGGTSTPAAQKVESGKKATQPATDPARARYTFVTWVKKNEVTGNLTGWVFNSDPAYNAAGIYGDNKKLPKVKRWGGMDVDNTKGQFYGTSNLRITTTDAPDLPGSQV